MACHILLATHDGADLIPEHRQLIELVLNDRATQSGLQAFRDLFEQVKTLQGYQKPWLPGLGSLSRDPFGNIYWRGSLIGHLTLYGTAEEWKRESQERWRQVVDGWSIAKTAQPRYARGSEGETLIGEEVNRYREPKRRSP